MADQYVAAASGITLTTSATVVLNVTSSSGSRRMNVNEFGISFNGTTSSATPVTVNLVRTTTAGTTGGTITQAATPMDSSAPSSLCTATMCTTAGGWGTGPTVGAILRTFLVSPTSGLVLQFPLGQEPDGPATSSFGFGIQVTAPAAVGVAAYLVWSE